MSQTVVNFLVDTTPGPGVPTLSLTPRIFDFEITPDSQTLYTDLMNQIKTNLVPGATSAQIQAVSDAVNALNAWSKLRLVDASGPSGAYVQTYQVNGVSVLLDASGNPLPPTSQPVPLNSLTADQLANPTFLVPSGVTSAITQTSGTMDQYMAQDVDKLLRSFRSAGWDPTDDPYAGGAIPAAVTSLTGVDASIYGVVDVGATTGLLTLAVHDAGQARLVQQAAATQSQSLQQVLMVDYVSRGNELLYNEMSQLRSAIDLNQTALSYLNSLQDLMNQKDPEQFVLRLEQLNDVVVGTDASQSIYDNYEKNTYNQNITAISKFKDDGTLGTYLTGNPIATDAFQAIDPAMSQIAVYSKQKIIDNLTYLTTQLAALNPTTPGAQQGLQLALTKILNDFNALPADGTANPIQLWVQDAAKGSDGDYQRHLNDAITSSQSFNDTEREELSRVMFVFEEFYKSADALLSRLTQLLEKIATAISR